MGKGLQTRQSAGSKRQRLGNLCHKLELCSGEICFNKVYLMFGFH